VLTVPGGDEPSGAVSLVTQWLGHAPQFVPVPIWGCAPVQPCLDLCHY